MLMAWQKCTARRSTKDTVWCKLTVAAQRLVAQAATCQGLRREAAATCCWQPRRAEECHWSVARRAADRDPRLLSNPATSGCRHCSSAELSERRSASRVSVEETGGHPSE